ncbi:MAG TPA: ATP-binding cassette domain-containing protein [Hellea balneolensis]|uniref:ATP-binding cassette domain-containing protein n=1 Tax=Hellea balneolensis TaxID=287478 RepID=A0A7C5M0C4_9PROT|nr:ATP-binding cassette domain-containing protein [Hellea balneolensis]
MASHSIFLAEAINIRTQFGANVVHENLNLQLRKNEILGVVGGSGSGKSVLLNTLLGLREPNAGTVKIFGRDRKLMSAEERRQLDNKIGVLFQGGALFSSLSVRENIMVPMREHTNIPVRLMRELADMKINMVGLPMRAAILKPADLSGGMRKRAGLARALALDPQLLFLDEPTAGLDPVGANAFDELILELREALDLTVFMVTHDLDSLYAICDRVAVLVDKHIAIADRLQRVIEFDHPWVKEYFGGPRSRAAMLAKKGNKTNGK